MEEKVIAQEDSKEEVFTKEQVRVLMRKRVEKTHNAFFSRYGVKDLEGLDEIVSLGYKYKKQLNEDTDGKTVSTEISFNELIGLENVKKKIDRLAALILKNSGVGIKQSMNYVFLGNPGTGKTVAARALTKTFFEKGIIKENKLTEVDRTMLVGEYIGQTAPKVKKVFEEAIGGVLFIDEAYSLGVDKNDARDYCHEVLMVLNKMMEDYRGQLVVILAGYKQETMEMLKGNRGLKSRINAYFDFKDYNHNELKEILNLIASKYKYTLDEDVQEKIIKIAITKQERQEYANARELRNILEGVMEFQAVRSFDEPWDRTITIEDLLEWQIENKVILDSDISEA